jgi:antitoxin VapB
MVMSESDYKLDRLRHLLAEHHLEALLLRRASSFAWATCGASCSVNVASTFGDASLLVTHSSRLVITNNIEAPRLEQEEGLGGQGWEFRVSPWYEPRDVVHELVRRGRLGSDSPYPGAVDLSEVMARLRADLTPEEGTRFRALARLSEEAIVSAARRVRPGQSEEEIARLLAQECESLGVQPIVNLIAVDERAFRYRHPVPTPKRLERYAMLVLCGRKHGLVCSVSRLVHFGKLPDDLRRKQEAVARVDASMIAATRPGSTLGQILTRGIDTYGEVGFPEEWHQHHQGGPAGYEPREWLVTPGSAEVVKVGQVFAWNPSIQGTKSEDTILVREDGPEILTESRGWPGIPVEIDGHTVVRPAILEEH